MSKNLLISEDNENTVTTLLADSSVPQKSGLTNKTKALIYANSYSIIAAIYGVGVKYMMLSGVRFQDIAFVRFVEAAFTAFIVLKCCDKNIFSDINERRDVRDIVVRSVFGFYAFNVNIIASEYVPLFILYLIISTNGLWASLLAYFFLGDVLHWKEMLGMLLGYAGLALIIVGNKPQISQSQEYNTFTVGVVLAISSALASSVLIVLTRKMRQIHYSVIQFNYTILGILGMSVYYLFSVFLTPESSRVEYTSGQYVQLVTFCSLNGIYMLLYTAAIQIEKVGVVAIVAYGQIVFTFLADILIFNYSISALQVVGGLLILVVNVYIGMQKLQNKL